jgi:uncharacterized membrane protein YraQ (UPF0718 family)
MDTDTAIMIVLAIILLLVALARGQGLWLEGLRAGVVSFARLLPILTLSFVIAGLMQVLIPREQLTRWLGAEAGFRAILVGCAVGALLPGPPYALYPMIIALFRGGASVGAVVGMMTGKVLWNVHYLPPALATLGPRLTLLQFGSNIVFPLLAGLIAQHVLGRLIR